MLSIEDPGDFYIETLLPTRKRLMGFAVLALAGAAH